MPGVPNYTGCQSTRKAPGGPTLLSPPFPARPQWFLPVSAARSAALQQHRPSDWRTVGASALLSSARGASVARSPLLHPLSAFFSPPVVSRFTSIYTSFLLHASFFKSLSLFLAGVYLFIYFVVDFSGCWDFLSVFLELHLLHQGDKIIFILFLCSLSVFLQCYFLFLLSLSCSK